MLDVDCVKEEYYLCGHQKLNPDIWNRISTFIFSQIWLNLSMEEITALATSQN